MYERIILEFRFSQNRSVNFVTQPTKLLIASYIEIKIASSVFVHIHCFSKFKFWNSEIKKHIRNRESIIPELKMQKNFEEFRKSNQLIINKSIRKCQFFHNLFFNEIFDGGTALERHPSAQSSCCAHTTCLILFHSPHRLRR